MFDGYVDYKYTIISNYKSRKPFGLVNVSDNILSSTEKEGKSKYQSRFFGSIDKQEKWEKNIDNDPFWEESY